MTLTRMLAGTSLPFLLSFRTTSTSLPELMWWIVIVKAEPSASSVRRFAFKSRTTSLPASALTTMSWYAPVTSCQRTSSTAIGLRGPVWWPISPCGASSSSTFVRTISPPGPEWMSPLVFSMCVVPIGFST